VVTFDNVGVGATTGTTPSTIEAMGHGAIAFLDAMDLQQVDLLGFSIGSFVAQEIALIRPDLLRRVVLASAAPQGAAGMHGWAPEVIAASVRRRRARRATSPSSSPTDTSREAGRQAAGRIFGGRTADRDEPTTWQTRQAQYDAVCASGIPNHSLLERVAAIELPVFVANGDSDPMILPRYSHLLAGSCRTRGSRSTPTRPTAFYSTTKAGSRPMCTPSSRETAEEQGGTATTPTLI
jgi:pimeloyl-ACP methyl ester carboxylesterase